MPKKNKIFSGKGLSQTERLEIEKQLKISSARDIEEMKRINERRAEKGKKSKGRRFTNIYKKSGFSSTQSGIEAHEKFKLLMNALPKSEREDIRDSGYGSGDIIEAADYVANEFVSGQSGKYFSKNDMLSVMKQLKEQRIDLLDEDEPIF